MSNTTATKCRPCGARAVRWPSAAGLVRLAGLAALALGGAALVQNLLGGRVEWFPAWLPPFCAGPDEGTVLVPDDGRFSWFSAWFTVLAGGALALSPLAFACYVAPVYGLAAFLAAFFAVAGNDNGFTFAWFVGFSSVVLPFLPFAAGGGRGRAAPPPIKPPGLTLFGPPGAGW